MEVGFDERDLDRRTDRQQEKFRSTEVEKVLKMSTVDKYWEDTESEQEETGCGNKNFQKLNHLKRSLRFLRALCCLGRETQMCTENSDKPRASTPALTRCLHSR